MGRAHAVVLVLALGCTSAPAAPPRSLLDAAPSEGATFGAIGDQALDTLLNELYASPKWRLCDPDVCGSSDSDWGADSLTYALYLRWSTTGDARLLPTLTALNGAGPTYGSCLLGACSGWSDIPSWDSVAASREYVATKDASALTRAIDAFDFVDASTAFALGACPAIDYQQPGGGANQLKTLETDSNYIKAALLLYEATSRKDYLTKAMSKYGSVRRYFKDPSVALYSVYVIDTGSTCTQIPRRFFGSVNGNMITSGLLLAHATHDVTYHDDAIATAMAVDSMLSDALGIYENLQAENDVVEPLVEAFYQLATTEAEPFARAWILRNASAAASDVMTTGTYGRFWGGPAPMATSTAWQTNGGIALAFAAAALAPTEGPTGASPWHDATFTKYEVTTLPATLTFTGSAIALFGTLGERCCDFGHARLFIDGVESFDQTGIWQNKSSSGRSLPGSVLFAWRWPATGTHRLGFEPGVPNAKEGGAFLHLTGYETAP